MAAKLLKSDVMLGDYPEFTASGGNDSVPIHAEFTLGAALEADDVIEMFPVPPGYVVHDIMLGSTDLDTNGVPTITLSLGILDGDVGDSTLANRVDSGGDIDDVFLTASTVGQAGGTARANLYAGMVVEPQEKPYSVGVQVITAPATGAVTGKVVVNATLRPAYRGK